MPRSRWRRIGLVTLLALAVFYGGFELGRTSSGYSIVDSMLERLKSGRLLGALRKENEALQKRVAAAEIGQRVEHQAQSETRRMIGELQAETARQQQELRFYRGLVARQFGAGTLRVQELKIRPEEDRRYRVMITLVQAAALDSIASGTLSFAIDGSRGGALVQLPLADVELNQRKELPFSLRFFQQIEVPIELPKQFQPASLQVEYRQGGAAEPARQTFAWRVEGEPESPIL
ncbi:MAG: DUF6776 family protein [Steroidobacteraceae bacterium]